MVSENSEVARAELLELILEVSFRRGKVTLASGKQSDFYLDLRQTLMRPRGIALAGALVLERLRAGPPVDAVGGMAVGAVLCVATALTLGLGVLSLRGHYFAICTLGLSVAVGEAAGGIEYIGAGSGMTAPLFPDELGSKGLFFAYFYFALTVVTFFALRWLYSTRFGLAINAIRDDEDKAEAMACQRPVTRPWPGPYRPSSCRSPAPPTAISTSSSTRSTSPSPAPPSASGWCSW